MTSLALAFQDDLYLLKKPCFLIKNDLDYEFYNPTENDAVLFMSMNGQYLIYQGPFEKAEYASHKPEHTILISKKSLIKSQAFLKIENISDNFDAYGQVLFYLDQIKYLYWKKRNLCIF